MSHRHLIQFNSQPLRARQWFASHCADKTYCMQYFFSVHHGCTGRWESGIQETRHFALFMWWDCAGITVPIQFRCIWCEPVLNEYRAAFFVPFIPGQSSALRLSSWQTTKYTEEIHIRELFYFCTSIYPVLGITLQCKKYIQEKTGIFVVCKYSTLTHK